MAGIKFQVIALLLAALIASSSAASSTVQRRQVPLTNGGQRPLKLGGERRSAKVKYYTVCHCAPTHPLRSLQVSGLTTAQQFDNTWLVGGVNKTYEQDDFLAFSHFGIVNVFNAQQKGYIHAKDLDCAATKPHALFTWPNNFTASSVIQANATALAAAGLSEFFDFIAVTWKPFGPAEDFTWIELDAWRIEGAELAAAGKRKATLISSLSHSWVGYDDDDGDSFFPAATIQPSEWWEGWGEGVNWLEIKAKAGDGRPWDLCLDNLLLLFHAKE